MSGRPTVTSPKAGKTSKGPVASEKTLPGEQSPSPENSRDDGSKIDDGVEFADEAVAKAAEGQPSADASASLPQSLHSDESPERSDDKEKERHHVQSVGEKEKRIVDADVEGHEQLNREITLRNQTIKGLRHELEESQRAYERKMDDLESEIAQGRSLRSELDSVRSTLVDLDDTHRSTLEKHDSLLRSRDKIIRNLSQEAESLRVKLGPTSDNMEQEGGSAGQDELLQFKDEEIQSLSETVQDLRKQLEAVDIARAKEIYDELLRSKDKEIASVSGVVKDLRGELEATDRNTGQENTDRLLQSKTKEIKSLSGLVKDLQEKLDNKDKAKEQEANHSEMSLRGEFQDLQNKQNRKIEELEAAAAARAATLQADYDGLLQLRDQEIKEMSGMAEDLQKEIESIHKKQQQESSKTSIKHEQQLQDMRADSDKKLWDLEIKHKQDLEAMRSAHNDADLHHASEFQELSQKHKHELKSARTDQQVADTNHQQELRETRRKYEQTLEKVKEEAQGELRDEVSRLEHEIDDKVTKHSQEIENAKVQHRTEIEDLSSNHERSLQDASLRHEQELEEAKANYQKELADVERLRGEGSNEISQQHEIQLEAIANKYQQELREAAQKYDDTTSRYNQQLEEVETSHERTKAEANRYQDQLKEVQQGYDALEREKHAQEEKLSELISTHDKDSEMTAAKHQEAIEQAATKHDEVTALIEKQNQEHQEKVSRLEQEIEHERSISKNAATDVTSLRAALQELELSRSKFDSEMELAHQKELRDAGSKHEHDFGLLHAEFKAAGAEIVSLKNALKESHDSRAQADTAALSEHEERSRNIASEHEQAMTGLRSEHDTTLAEMAVVQADLQSLNQKLNQEHAILRGAFRETELAKEEARVEITLLNDRLELSSRDKNAHKDRVSRLENIIEEVRGESSNLTEDLVREKKEAAVEIALQKDKLELKTREVHQHQEVIEVLREDIEKLQAQMTRYSEDLKRERNEAAVEIALLKDKLELSELQKQSAAEDISLSRNESNVEIALLKDKLELSDLQTQQDKDAIAALEKRLQELHAQPVDTSSFVHQQLRDDLAMLARHHAANLADVEALKESILAERDVREAEWKKRVLSRDHLNKDMQEMRAELSGIVGAH